jgi:predicted amidohydrolase
MDRRNLICFCTVAALGFSTLLGNAIAQQTSSDYDVVILNGRVMDPETSLDAVRNVGVRGRKIEAISSEALRGRTTLDARGLVVSRGFIDLHQHGQSEENDVVKAADGVTTALELEIGVADVDAWYAARAKKALINFGASIGHIPVRMAVMRDSDGLGPVYIHLVQRTVATRLMMAAKHLSVFS